MFKKFLTCVLMVTLFTCSGCNTSTSTLSRQAMLFDTIIQIQIYDTQQEEVLDQCIEICNYYENLLSRTVEGSDIHRINHANGEAVAVSDETIVLLNQALYYCELSDGAFDISFAPVSDLWDFQNNTGTLPDSQALENTLSHVGYQKILISGNKVQLSDSEMQIDLGGIAKGYIADQLKAYLISENIEHALIDLGGNILTLGGKPDGSDFRIAIQKPFDAQGTPITSVETKEDSVVSSGVYQRYFSIDDTIYHHILDTSTGYPCNNELYGVTIITNSSTDADALSTICLALGLEKGLSFIQSLDYAEAIFITNEYELIYSD